ISARAHEPAPGAFEVKSMEPYCGHQGDTKRITFTGEGLSGCGVCFGKGNNIRTKGTTYSHSGEKMEAEIVISRRARIGEYPVMLFMADGRSKMAPRNFKVVAEMESALARFEVTQAPAQIDECEQEQQTTGKSVGHEMGHGMTDTGRGTQTDPE